LFSPVRTLAALLGSATLLRRSRYSYRIRLSLALQHRELRHSRSHGNLAQRANEANSDKDELTPARAMVDPSDTVPSLKIHRPQRKWAIFPLAPSEIRVGTVDLSASMLHPRYLTLVSWRRLASGVALPLAPLLPCYVLEARNRPSSRLTGCLAKWRLRQRV
jgi:hypothetical protein